MEAKAASCHEGRRRHYRCDGVDRCRHRNGRGIFDRTAGRIFCPGTSTFREVLARYGHWLVAGLTFQLAADVIETSIAPSWQEIGRLGAIAVIRTFLNFFLERDLAELGQVAGQR